MATDFKSIISSKSKEVAAILAKDFREELDTRTHILDLSYEALKVNVYRGSSTNLSKIQTEAYNKIYARLLEVVIASVPTTRTFPSLEDVPKEVLSTLKTKGVLLIHGPIGTFIVGNSFDSIRTFTTNKISKNPKLRATRFGSADTFIPKLDAKGRVIPDDFKKVTKSKLDVGHIASDNSSNLTSPLEEKIQAVLKQGYSLGNSGVISSAKNALSTLYSVQADFAYTFKNTTPEAIEQARSKLGELYVVVTLHTAKKNNDFSKKENAIYFKLLKDIANSIDITNISGSNSIQEDIIEGFCNILVGKGKLPKHSSKTERSSVKLKAKNNVTASNLTISIPAIQESRINLSSLLVYINSHLQSVISANMGGGNETKILNYRSGRFAGSAKVEKLSESRAGMITAFYSYMKNPYQTFEPGFAQGSPASRNPRNLIGTSIREIAATKVANQLRAVSV